MATTSAPATADAILSSTHATLRFRRVAGAIALPLAFTLQLVCNATYAWVSTESGLTDTEGSAEALEMYGRYPSAFVFASTLAMIGVLLMVPGLLAALKVLRPCKPRLALVTVALMIAGYVSYFGIVMSNFNTLGLALYALAHPDANAAAIVDAAQASPVTTVFFGLFVIGNLVGTLLLGLAVMLSRTLPWYAGRLIMCWTFGHLVNILGGGEWFAVAGGALEIVGLCIVAAAAVRTTDAEWAARG